MFCRGKPDPTDLNYTVNPGKYKAWVAYGQSKSANILYAKSLAEKLKGTKLQAVSVHPGIIQTALWRQSFFNKMVGGLIAKKSVPQGAATSIYACVCPRIMTEGMRGEYLIDCGPSTELTDYCLDANGELREAVWQATEKELQGALTAAGLGSIPPLPTV